LPEPYQALISVSKEKDAPDFKFNDEETPFAAEGREIAQLIRRKASTEEFDTVIGAIEEAAASLTLLDPQLASTDALVTAICWVGSKSMSHVLACIERCKDRLVALNASSTKRQIITSVMDYWRDHPGIGVNIVNKLLNYLVLSPENIIEWALVDHVERGTALAQAWFFELTSNTVNKVTSRVRAIVHALRQPGGLPEEHREKLQLALEKETGEMRALFGMIENSLVSVREGLQDQIMESSDALRKEDALVRVWVATWIRVFQRRLAVEENWVKEELAKPVPTRNIVQDVKMGEDVAGNAAGMNGGRDYGVQMEINELGDGIE
jgi:nuclear cap-binding protein subunit 1